MTIANIHVSWQGKERSFPVPIPTGPSTLCDLLPAAREIAGQATALAIDQAERDGKSISCRKGCGACCRQLVAISVVEAQGLANLVASMPADRQSAIRNRFADAIDRLESAGLLDPQETPGARSILASDHGSREASLQAVGRRYFQLQIACPFLEEESCSIHEQRPIVCREHHVTTPAENCARLYELSVDRVEPARRVGEALARTAARAGLREAFMIPLVLSLEWSEANRPRLFETEDGPALFQTLMGELQGQ